MVELKRLTCMLDGADCEYDKIPCPECPIFLRAQKTQERTARVREEMSKIPPGK